MRLRTILAPLTAAALCLLPAADAVANPPGNDHRKDAWTLSVPGSTSGTTSGATLEAQHDGNRPGPGGHSVWFTWTAPAAGRLTLTVTAPSFDSVIAAYPGWYDPSDSPHEKDADKGAADTNSSIQIDTKAGQTWEIAVDGMTASQFGTYTLVSSFDTTPPPPANDDFAGAVALAPMDWKTWTDIRHRYATKELGEPMHRTQGTPAKSVWFKFTPPSTGHVKLWARCSSSADLWSTNTTVAVYTGATLATLDEVPYTQTDAGGCSFDTVTFKAFAGTTYRIAVDNASADTGSSAIQLRFDGDTPTTSFASSPAVLGPTGSIAFHADEDAWTSVSYQCRVDNEPAKACTSAYKVGGHAEGPHTLYVRATDEFGNVETSWKAKPFTLDKTPPQTTITSGPAPVVPSAKGQTFVFESSEPGSTFKCQWYAFMTPEPCSSPHTLTSPSLGGGAYTMKVWATDPRGNADPTPAIWEFKADSSAFPPAPGAPKPAGTTTSTSGTATPGTTTSRAATSTAAPSRLIVRTTTLRRGALIARGLQVRVRCPYRGCGELVKLRLGRQVLGTAVAQGDRWTTLRLTRLAKATVRRQAPKQVVAALGHRARSPVTVRLRAR